MVLLLYRRLTCLIQNDDVNLSFFLKAVSKKYFVSASPTDPNWRISRKVFLVGVVTFSEMSGHVRKYPNLLHVEKLAAICVECCLNFDRIVQPNLLRIPEDTTFGKFFETSVLPKLTNEHKKGFSTSLDVSVSA